MSSLNVHGQALARFAEDRDVVAIAEEAEFQLLRADRAFLFARGRDRSVNAQLLTESQQ